MALMNQGDCGAAQLAWDDVVRQVPEFGFAHYMRGQCVGSLLYQQRPLEEYQGNIQRSLADLDQAIALGPYASGEIYFVRGAVLQGMAIIHSNGPDMDHWRELALESNRLAVANGADPTWMAWEPSLDLIALGRCQEALDEIDQLVAASHNQPEVIGLAETRRARAEICAGDFDRAYQQVELAIDDQATPARQAMRMAILFDMGRFDQAESLLNEMIDANPYYDGYRYYMRALIEFDKGELDKMWQDLDAGHANSWGTSPIEMYIYGMLALQADDTAGAVLYLQRAEQLIGHGKGAFEDRVRNQLEALHANRVVPTPNLSYQPTPHPTLAPTPTARPQDPNPLEPGQTLLRVVMQDGAGPLAVAYHHTLYIQFQPSSPIARSDVQKVTIDMTLEPPPSVHQVTNWPPETGAWDFAKGGWRHVSAPMPIEITDRPGDVLADDGSLFLYMNCRDEGFAFINHISVKVQVRLPDGSLKDYGTEPGGF
jgi:tetratricopeptide (TPR) repeat protein